LLPDPVDKVILSQREKRDWEGREMPWWMLSGSGMTG
jgi:hypothetical protein